MVANGSLITDLLNVRLKHCEWNLGSAHAKHFKGGREKVWVVVTRRHQHRRGLVRFVMVDSAHQRTLVRSHV